MFPTTNSPSVILYGSPLPFPASAELVEIFSQFFFPQRGFSLSCAQCNAYLLYCARNKQPARGQGRSTCSGSDSIASSFCHMFAWKEWKHFVVSSNVPSPQLSWGGQHTELLWSIIRYFSGALKTHIYVPLIFICNNTHIEYKAKSPIDYCVNLPCNNKPYCALLSSITRVRRTLCAIESRSARYVTMERRTFARTLLWRNNHIHDTLSIVT